MHEVADLVGEFDTATVFPGVRLAGVISMEMGGRNKGVESCTGGRGFSDGLLGLAAEPFGRRKMLKARRRRRKAEKIEASGSFCKGNVSAVFRNDTKDRTTQCKWPK